MHSPIRFAVIVVVGFIEFAPRMMPFTFNTAWYDSCDLSVTSPDRIMCGTRSGESRSNRSHMLSPLAKVFHMSCRELKSRPRLPINRGIRSLEGAGDSIARASVRWRCAVCGDFGWVGA